LQIRAGHDLFDHGERVALRHFFPQGEKPAPGARRFHEFVLHHNRSANVDCSGDEEKKHWEHYRALDGCGRPTSRLERDRADGMAGT
jgi:hypothetical protein